MPAGLEWFQFTRWRWMMVWTCAPSKSYVSLLNEMGIQKNRRPFIRKI